METIDRETLQKEIHTVLDTLDTNTYLQLLHTMSRFHKYDISQQINLLFHAPDEASAVAAEDIWKRLGYALKEGAKGIPVLSGYDPKPQLVYDVSDTSAAGENLRWQYDDAAHGDFFDVCFPSVKDHGRTENKITDLVTDYILALPSAHVITAPTDTAQFDFLVASVSHIVLERMGFPAQERVERHFEVKVEEVFQKYLDAHLGQPLELLHLLEIINHQAASILNPLGNYIHERERIENGRTIESDRRAGGMVSRTDRALPKALPDDRKAEAVEGNRGEREGERIPAEIRGGVRTEVSASDQRIDGETWGDRGTAQSKLAGIRPAGDGGSFPSMGTHAGGNSVLTSTEVSLFDTEDNRNAKEPQQDTAASSRGKKNAVPEVVHKIIAREISFAEALQEIGRRAEEDSQEKEVSGERAAILETGKKEPQSIDIPSTIAPLSPSARQVYETLFTGLKKGNNEVQKSAQASAILGARMAERIAALHQEAGEETYTAEQALPQVLSDMTHADAEIDVAQVFLQAALNVGVDLDQEVPVLDITNYVVELVNKNQILRFIKEIIRGEDLLLTADECAAIGILKKDDRHITYSSKKVKGIQESIRNGAICSIKDLVKNAVLIESIPNRKIDKKPKIRAYHRFYVPVQVDNIVWTIRLVAEEQQGVITLNPTEVNLYDIILEKRRLAVPTGTKPVMDNSKSPLASTISDKLFNVKVYENDVIGEKKTSRTSTGISPVMESARSLSMVTIREMLSGVKDYSRNFYINLDGTGNYALEQANIENTARVRGTYSQIRGMIHLLEDADESTFIHEMSHHYLFELEKLAKDFPKSEAAQDHSVIMKWARWQKGQAAAYIGTASEKEFLALDSAIRDAEQRGDHLESERLKKKWAQERFARGFEEYLRGGKAPVPTLQSVFQRFTHWLKRFIGT